MSDPTNAHQAPPEPTNGVSEPIGQLLERYGVPAATIRDVNNWVSELIRLKERDLPRAITLSYMPRGEDGSAEHGRGCWTVMENGRVQPALDPRECLAQVAAMLLGAPHPTLWDPVERQSYHNRQVRELNARTDRYRERQADAEKELFELREAWDALPWDLTRRVADSLGLAVPEAGNRLTQVLRFAADAALSSPLTLSVPSITRPVDELRFTLQPEAAQFLRQQLDEAISSGKPFSGRFYRWGFDAEPEQPVEVADADPVELAELMAECGHPRSELELDWWAPDKRAAAYDWCIRWQHWQASSTAPGWDDLPEAERQAWAANEPPAPWFLTGEPEPAEPTATTNDEAFAEPLAVVDAEFVPEPGTEPLRPGDAGYVATIEGAMEKVDRAMAIAQELYGSPAVDLEAAAAEEHAGFGLEPVTAADLAPRPAALIDRNALHLALTRRGWTISNTWLRAQDETTVLAIAIELNAGGALPQCVQDHHEQCIAKVASALAAAPPSVLSGLPVAGIDKGGDDIAASQV